METRSDTVQQLLRSHLRELQQSYGLTRTEMRRLLTAEPPELRIPLDIYTRQHGILEASVQYLVDRAGIAITDVADRLSRSESTIRNSLAKSRAKGPLPTSTQHGQEGVPTRILASRDDAPLRAVIGHLRQNGWRHCEIARALDRDQRTISSTWRRRR